MTYSGCPEKIVLGTMRMLEKKQSPEEWAEFFAYAYEIGIRKMHCSNEYESYSLLTKTLEILDSRHGNVRFEHVVKLAAPSFDEPGFDAEVLIERVTEYLADLGAGEILDLQWMWRSDLKNDQARCKSFSNCFSAINDCVRFLKSERLIKDFLCFPYSTSFADLAVGCPFIDGLVVYRNPLELDYERQLQRCVELGKRAVVIRPFAGGRLFEDKRIRGRELLAFSTMHPGISDVVATFSTKAHLAEALGI